MRICSKKQKFPGRPRKTVYLSRLPQDKKKLEKQTTWVPAPNYFGNVRVVQGAPEFQMNQPPFEDMPRFQTNQPPFEAMPLFQTNQPPFEDMPRFNM